MNKEVSNSMSKENDPHFEVITPVCFACKHFDVNADANNDCTQYKNRPNEFKYAKSYNCPKMDLDKNNPEYENIKDKL